MGQLGQEIAASAEMLFLGVATFHHTAACTRRRGHVEDPYLAGAELAQLFCDDDAIAVPNLDIDQSPFFSIWVAALYVFVKA